MITMTEPEILYRDKDIIVVRKPAGMASQPDRSLGMDLVSWLKNTLARQEGSVPEILPVHRLDRPVGGVIVYAGNRTAAAKLSAQLTDGRMQKEYLAVLKLHQDQMPDVIAEEYRALYRRAARAAYKIVRVEDEGGDRRKQRKEATPAEIEMILCSGIPKNSSGNLVNVSRSILNKQFQKKRMSRQRISRAMKYSNVIERFDFITLLFLVYAIEVEPDWPVERFMAYIDEINEILARCNMMNIYPVNPYESFILMCLLTEEPLGTYADIWELSFEKK